MSTLWQGRHYIVLQIQVTYRSVNTYKIIVESTLSRYIWRMLKVTVASLYSLNRSDYLMTYFYPTFGVISILAIRYAGSVNSLKIVLTEVAVFLPKIEMACLTRKNLRLILSSPFRFLILKLHFIGNSAQLVSRALKIGLFEQYLHRENSLS